jgi:hypothetical protein
VTRPGGVSRSKAGIGAVPRAAKQAVSAQNAHVGKCTGWFTTTGKPRQYETSCTCSGSEVSVSVSQNVVVVNLSQSRVLSMISMTRRLYRATCHSGGVPPRAIAPAAHAAALPLVLSRGKRAATSWCCDIAPVLHHRLRLLRRPHHSRYGGG